MAFVGGRLDSSSYNEGSGESRSLSIVIPSVGSEATRVEGQRAA